MTQIAHCRGFDGSDDEITLAQTLTTATDLSFATILRVTGDPVNNFQTVLGCAGGAGSFQWGFNGNDDGFRRVYLWTSESGEAFASQFDVPPGEWVLIAGSKPNGSSTGRCHMYVYDTDTWTHSDAAAAPLGDCVDDLTGGTLRIGEWPLDGEPAFVDIAAVAAWTNSVFASDAAVEALQDSWQAWLDADPTAAWLLNQPQTSDGVTDAIGSADETSRTGTTVVAISDLPFDAGGASYTIVNGSDETLTNVNAGGTDVDPGTYKDGVALTETELATLLTGGTADVAVFPDLTADAQARQRKKATLTIPHAESA